MSRSQYSDDNEPLVHGRWRAQVASALRGKRGQALLRDMIAALDAMPEKRLVADVMQADDGTACALTAVARYRGVSVEDIDNESPEPEDLASRLDIAHQLAQEVMFVNDEAGWSQMVKTPEDRWTFVRSWAVKNLREKEVTP